MAPSVYTLDNPVFRHFLFYAVASLLKMMAMSFLTGRQRFLKIAFANREDIPSTHRQSVQPNTSDPDVERVRRNHLNDLENIVPFVLIGFGYVSCGPSPHLALWHFRLFFVSRLCHTLAYQIPLAQPTRLITFVVGLLVTLSMAVQLLFTLA